jgi:tol-pal system protein YbgF
MNRAAVVACLAAALLSGCATRSAVRQVADDLQAVYTEVQLLRQAQDALSRRLVEVEDAAQASRARTEKLQAMMAATVSDMERLVTQLDEAHEAIASLREELATRVAAAPAAPPPSTPERPTETRRGSAETPYAAGLANFRGREYGQAVLDFLDVVTKHPSHALAPSAQYWIGEAYYLQHDYRQALTEFQTVLDWGPTSPKAAEALLKVGLCYSHLREGTRAQEVWRRVLREFPDSPSADQARTLLARRGPTR